MRAAAALRVPLVALLATACSVLVEPSDDRVRCEARAGFDPCPAGQRCLDGFCTTIPDGGLDCQPQEIGCNEIDDDCDGEIDEGSDLDGDGFTWCASDPRLRDCRDDNSAIHPAGPDTPAPPDPPCDSADNDCDGLATECPTGQACDAAQQCRVPDCTFAFACPTGQRCDTSVTPAACETVETDCMVTGCAADLVCDPFTRSCTPPLQIGAPCGADSQCGGGNLCVARTALGLTAEDARGDAICSRACCTDAECGIAARCWVSGSGARGCVADAILAAGPQGAPAEMACTRNAECSGTCALRRTPAYRSSSRYSFSCGAAVGTSNVACDFSSDCRSGLCLEYCLGFLCESACSAACGATADCSDVETCGWVDIGGGAFTQSCLLGRDGGGTAGASCTSDDACRDGACVSGATGRYCADVCCSNDHCSAGHRCRPQQLHGRWEMLCVRE